MTVLVAMNGFKGSATAAQATRWVAEGLRIALPQWEEVEEQPVCDGGGGFCETVTLGRGGTVEGGYPAHDAGLRPVADARIGWVHDPDGGLLAVVEAADTVGLARLGEGAPGVMDRSSYGLGEVLAHAHRGGARRVLLGCGDSGVQDCGVGLLEALGAVFSDRGGAQLTGLRARDLSRVATVEFRTPPGFLTVELACNLSSVLEGAAATARTYAAQKGATSDEVRELERGTRSIARVFARAFRRDVSRAFGAGANGGAAAALIAALGATPRYSFHVVNEAVGLTATLQRAKVVVVGEGKLDAGTVRGKAPGAVALLAASHGVPAVAVAGAVEPHSFGRLAGGNILAVQTLSHPCQRLADYLDPANTRTLLREAGVRLAPTICLICSGRRDHEMPV